MYDYLVFDAAAVYMVFMSPAIKPEFKENKQTAAILMAVDEGYRWIRTDGPWAIFERPPCNS